MPRAPSAVQHEIKQSKPFQSAGQEAVLALLRTASVLQRFYARLIEPHGLTSQQYNVLRILRGAGSRGLATLAIRDRMVEQAPGITRLIDKLESEGFVRRQRGTPDRRQVFCTITSAGLALLRRLDPVVDRADDEALGMLSVMEQRTLIRLLDRVRARHQDVEGEAEEKGEQEGESVKMEGGEAPITPPTARKRPKARR